MLYTHSDAGQQLIFTDIAHVSKTISKDSASEVTTLWRYTNLLIIIIIIINVVYIHAHEAQRKSETQKERG